MTTLFFYGTLRHRPLLESVLGRVFQDDECREGVLRKHQARAIKGVDFPMICEMDGEAAGLLCQNLSEQEVARLNYYEGGFDYELRDVTIDTAKGPSAAQVYFPIQSGWRDAGPWDLTRWITEDGALAVEASHEVMEHFGVISDAELEAMFPMIRSRAASRLAARGLSPAASPSGFGRQDIEDAGAPISHRGYFILRNALVRFRQFAGGMSAQVKREVFVGSDASILLPYDPVRDRVLLIEQFRPGPYVRGDEQPWMLEPIAGRIDPGESAEDAAFRETQEEAGLQLSSLHNVAKCYASPGCNTEYFHIFVGCTDLPDDVIGVSGVANEAEDIKSYLYSFDELMEMTDKMRAANAPLVLAALWLARHRESLREAA